MREHDEQQVDQEQDEEYRAIGRRLRKAREDLGLSQTDVAVLLDVNYATYGRWETGARRPALTDLRKLAGILRVSFGTLLGVQPGRQEDILAFELEAMSPAEREETLRFIRFRRNEQLRRALERAEAEREGRSDA